MTVNDSTMEGWLHLIKAEYLEMPGLNLTKPQVQRLWNLEAKTCDTLLDTLTTDHFLEKTDHESYVLAGCAHH
jgi:hypothetical protein